MLYNYNYDVAALIAGLFILAIYLIRRTLRTRSNSVLGALLVCSIIASSFDIVSCFSISFPDRYPMWFNYLTCYGYLFFYNEMGVLFLAYVDTKTRIKALYRPLAIYYKVITALEFILIITSSFTHLVSYFDVNNKYAHGPAMVLLEALALMHLMGAAGLFIHERRRFNRYQVMTIVAFIVVVFLGVIIQILVPSLLVGQFGCTLVLFFIYTSLENPVYYTYRGTTCYNRRAFFEIMKNLLRENQDISLYAFCIKDFDNMMSYLDYKNIGRLASVIADHLALKYKTNAFVLSDDKFIILMNSEFTEQYINKDLEELFSNPISLPETEIQVSINSAVIRHVDSGKKPDIVESGITYVLDNGLGRDVNLDFKEIVERINRRKAISTELKRAIKDDLFDVYYQPIMDVASGKFHSAEALIRFKSDTLGFVSPEEFIPIAEKEGLIIQIGEMVFEKVCRFIKDNKVTTELGVRYIEINLSPIQCVEPGIVRKFRDIMDQNNIVPFWINLEITETAELENNNDMNRNITNFHNLGITFSLDDYGSGFAAVDYLFKFPVDIVKIDKSILWQAMEDVNAGIVLISTMKMLKTLGKKIVVEGVENEEMVNLLRDNGCDYMQGYYYSKPVPAYEYVEFLKERNK